MSNLHNRLDRLEKSQPFVNPFGHLSDEELQVMFEESHAESKARGCPDCHDCPAPEICAEIERVNERLRT